MTALSASLKLYLKLAIDRRQILARHMAIRIGLGVVAGIVLLVGIALLNVALFLVLRPTLGDLWSVVAVAALHFAIGGAFAVFALSEPSSAELHALAEAETAAFAALDSEAHGTLAGIAATQQRINAGLSLTANVLPGLINLMRRPAKAATAEVSQDSRKLEGDKT